MRLLDHFSKNLVMNLGLTPCRHLIDCNLKESKTLLPLDLGQTENSYKTGDEFGTNRGTTASMQGGRVECAHVAFLSLQAGKH